LNKKTTANTRFGHWLADVHSGSFAPAFTLSFHDSERSLRQLTDKCPELCSLCVSARNKAVCVFIGEAFV